MCEAGDGAAKIFYHYSAWVQIKCHSWIYNNHYDIHYQNHWNISVSSFFLFIYLMDWLEQTAKFTHFCILHLGISQACIWIKSTTKHQAKRNYTGVDPKHCFFLFCTVCLPYHGTRAQLMPPTWHAIGNFRVTLKLLLLSQILGLGASRLSKSSPGRLGPHQDGQY